MTTKLSDNAQTVLTVIKPLGHNFTVKDAAQTVGKDMPELKASTDSFASIWGELKTAKKVQITSIGEDGLPDLYEIAS